MPMLDNQCGRNLMNTSLITNEPSPNHAESGMNGTPRWAQAPATPGRFSSPMAVRANSRALSEGIHAMATWYAPVSGIKPT
jgi:hypothetical protein